MRRGIGVAGIQRRAQVNEQFKDAGSALALAQMDQMKSQFESFKSQLLKFASEHGKEIKKDPKFRMHFQKMCNSIGVDPLASNKGFWAEMLGVGDFYFELGVQIVDICISTRSENGGFLDFHKLKQRLLQTRQNTIISDDDIVRAIKNLKPLGCGFGLIECGGKKLVQSVPKEMATDHLSIINIAEANHGQISAKTISDTLKWEMERVENALSQMVADGLLWIDDDDKGKITYWTSSTLILA